MSTPKFMVLLTLFFSSTGFYAQSLERSVVATTGQSDHQNGIFLDWTVGEIAVSSISTSEMTLTEGFHQSYLTVKRIESDAQNPFSIRIAPNPVRGELNVFLDEVGEQSLRLELFDISGRQLDLLKVDPTIQLVRIDMFNYPASTYILKATSLDDPRKVSSYKITKVN